MSQDASARCLMEMSSASRCARIVGAFTKTTRNAKPNQWNTFIVFILVEACAAPVPRLGGACRSFGVATFDSEFRGNQEIVDPNHQTCYKNKVVLCPRSSIG